ncbi:TetR/AcrR family transcriptional regulator [Sphaerisporangium aureirubrum]|uniref:TetR/AcrR family transcriptional regulator n=1 Tax=Sphaerisporangium aureirubrum TaxID=1544736 RepID=A0ABW1NU68_9ACTN
MSEPGLRERKKQQTRKSISDMATWLFMTRGFDTVTVAEVASAAGVSTKTVFNYFPRKEDLFFDRMPEAVEMISRAVRERPEGTAPLTAIRELVLRLLGERHPLAGVGHFREFWQVVIDSPALQARVRESVQELEELVTELFAEATGTAPDDPWCRMTAALTVTVYRTAYLTATRRIMAGDHPDAVAVDYAALLSRAFDALAGSLTARG